MNATKLALFRGIVVMASCSLLLAASGAVASSQANRAPVGGMSTPVAAAPAPPPHPPAAHPNPAHPGPPSIAGPAQVDRLGQAKYAHIYGGLVAIDDGALIDVYLTTPSADAERALTAASDGMPLSFKTAPQSLEALNDLEDRVSGAIPELAKCGVDVASAETRIDKGRVVIGVIGLTDGDEDTIRSVVRSNLVEVEPAAGIEVGATRQPDASLL